MDHDPIVSISGDRYLVVKDITYTDSERSNHTHITNENDQTEEIMSRIVIVAAIEIEMAPFIATHSIIPDTWCQFGEHEIWLAFTGIGPVAASYHIQKLIIELRPDWIIQAGVGGVYSKCGIQVGETVCIIQERLADLGVMLDDKFCNIFPDNHELKNPHKIPVDFPEVAGFTVNTGCAPIVEEMRALFYNDNACVESMEGYALFFVCLNYGIKFAEIRCISNLVANERSSWNIPLSTKNLAKSLSEVLGKIN